jgi:predicted RNA binding protein YcfA (HicA-like mRNA interferase family)
MKKSILDDLLSGLSDKNMRFSDLRKLVLNFGFVERTKGGHHVFSKTGIVEIINMQPGNDGKAKAYQVKQVRGLVIKHKLHREE